MSFTAELNSERPCLILEEDDDASPQHLCAHGTTILACRLSTFQCYAAYRHELRCGHISKTHTAYRGCATNCKIVSEHVKIPFACAQCTNADAELHIVEPLGEDEKHASDSESCPSNNTSGILQATTALTKSIFFPKLEYE